MILLYAWIHKIKIFFAGKELIDIFKNHSDKKINGDEEETEFKEPAELNGKLRWQIIRLIPAKSKSPLSADEKKNTLHHPPVDGAEDQTKKTAAGVGDSDHPGECNEEIEDLVKKEIDVS